MKFYTSFQIAEGAPHHFLIRAPDMAIALQRLTDFVAGRAWDAGGTWAGGSIPALRIEEISMTKRRGIEYDDRWLS